MKTPVILLASIVIVFNTIAQPRGGVTRSGVPTTTAIPGDMAGAEGMSAQPELVELILVPFQKLSPEAQPTFGQPADNNDTLAVETLLQRAWNEAVSKIPPTAPGFYGGVRAIRLGDHWLAEVDKDRAAVVAETLKKEFAPSLKLPETERKAKLDDLAKQFTKVNSEMLLLNSLAASEEKLGRELMSEKMKALELERQRIDMELYAKQERRKALAAQMDEIKTTLSDKVQQDEVLEQLNKIVDARLAGVKRVEELIKNKAASNSEVEEAEGKVAEAKARVAERKELLRQSNGSDILARFTEDMSTVMVDVAELEGRKRYIASQLPDVATITEPQLESLLQHTQYLNASNAPPPMKAQLMKKYEDTLYQRGALLLKDVRIVARNDPATTQPALPE